MAPGSRANLTNSHKAAGVDEGEQTAFDHLRHIEAIVQDTPNGEAWCLSRDPLAKKLGNVYVFPWKLGLQRLFQT